MAEVPIKEGNQGLVINEKAVFHEEPIISLRVDANRDFRIRIYELDDEEIPAKDGVRRIVEIPKCVNELMIKAPEDLKPGQYAIYEIEISYCAPKFWDANPDKTGIAESHPA